MYKLFLISVFIFTAADLAKAGVSVEVQEAIRAAEAYQKACENSASRTVREKKLEELKREDYFKLKEICASYSIQSTLRAVQNINKLEKANIEKLPSLPESERNKNFESRVVFLTDTMQNTPITFAENLIFLVILGRYSDLAYELKSDDLKNIMSANLKKIRDQKEKIYTATMKHDLTLLLAESRYANSGTAREAEVFRKFIEEFTPYTNEIKKNLTCLSQQKCKICGDKFEAKCSSKISKASPSSDFETFRSKYEDATENFFKRVNRL